MKAFKFDQPTITIYTLITEDGVDQHCETLAQANKEKRDLQALGCTVKIKKFNSWADAQAYEDKLNS